MKKSTLLFLTILSISSLYLISAYGRSPAVEPVSGISIDDYEAVEPGDGKGLDLSKNTAEIITTSNSNKASKEISKDSLSEKSGNNFWLFIAILLAPFLSYYFLTRKTTKSNLPNNVEFLKDYKKPETTDHDDDQNVKKAS